MILAFSKIIPPSYFYHNPSLRNSNGNTVEMILRSKGITPHEEW